MTASRHLAILSTRVTIIGERRLLRLNDRFGSRTPHYELLPITQEL
jgi:hypothetical protein